MSGAVPNYASFIVTADEIVATHRFLFGQN